jgi:3'-5' exonuclease
VRAVGYRLVMATIAIDIEVVGFQWEDIDETTREYLLRRERNEARRKSIPDRLALHLGLGRVIAIGMWFVEQDTGLILLEGETEERRAWDSVPGAEILRGPEEHLLERFWSLVGPTDVDPSGPRIVTYNGRGYDGPVLCVRSAQLDIQPSRRFTDPARETASHCDLMDVMTFYGASRDRFSLDYWCRRFGVESPKAGIDGSQVGQAYADGRIEEIGAYCLRDVKATAELFQRVSPALLAD